MNKWDSNEIEMLRKYFPTALNEELEALFPNRSRQGIYKKAYILGIKKQADTLYRQRVLGREKVFYLREKTRTKKGYVLVYNPQHPRADANGRVLEHIVVWEKTNGKLVPPGYVVHHINGIKDDNRPENLLLLTAGAHSSLHNASRKISPETRSKISEKQKLHYSNGNKPWVYKEINITSVVNDLSEGMLKKDICKKYGICRTTLYRKLKRSKQNG